MQGTLKRRACIESNQSRFPLPSEIYHKIRNVSGFCTLLDDFILCQLLGEIYAVCSTLLPLPEFNVKFMNKKCQGPLSAIFSLD